VIDRLRVSRTPFREAIGPWPWEGWSRSSLTAAFLCAAFPATKRRDLYELYNGLNIAVELAVPQMSDATSDVLKIHLLKP